MSIRRIIEHTWATNQDERENALRQKYPKVFGRICNNFYRVRNDNPSNTPDFCLMIALMKEKIREKTKKDFEDVFVNKFELGLR